MNASPWSRIPSLLHWQLRFDSRRALPWLIAGCYLLLAGPALICLVQLLSSRPGGPRASQEMLVGLMVLHWLLAPGYAVFRAARTVEDRTSGVLALIKLSNVSPGAWVAFRLLSVITGYFQVWVVRLPLYALAIYLGGIRFETIVVAELFQWIAFLTVASIALLVARFYDTPQTAQFAIVGLVVLAELGLLLPIRIFLGFRLWLGQGGIFGSELLRSSLDVMSHLSLLPYAWDPPRVADQWLMAGVAIFVHLNVAGAALMALRRTVFFNIGVDDSIGSKAAAGRKQSAGTRESRRVWDDALAWLCFHVHGNGYRTIRIKAIVYFLMSLLLAAIVVSPSGLLLTFMVISPPVVASIASFKTGDCLVRELRGQTLASLALLPCDEMDLYRGWKRGAWRLAIPDLLYVATALFLMLVTLEESTFPHTGGIILTALCGAILIGSPFFFLNNLLSWDRRSVATGCLSTLLIVVIPGLPGIVAANGAPAVGVAVFVLLAITAHFIFEALIPGAFRRRMDKLA